MVHNLNERDIFSKKLLKVSCVDDLYLGNIKVVLIMFAYSSTINYVSGPKTDTGYKVSRIHFIVLDGVDRPSRDSKTISEEAHEVSIALK